MVPKNAKVHLNKSFFSSNHYFMKGKIYKTSSKNTILFNLHFLKFHAGTLQEPYIFIDSYQQTAVFSYFLQLIHSNDTCIWWLQSHLCKVDDSK